MPEFNLDTKGYWEAHELDAAFEAQFGFRPGFVTHATSLCCPADLTTAQKTWLTQYVKDNVKPSQAERKAQREIEIAEKKAARIQARSEAVASLKSATEQTANLASIKSALDALTKMMQLED